MEGKELHLLVFNCGSSSLNYKVYVSTEDGGLEVALSGKAHRVGVTGSEPSFIEHRRDGQAHRQVVAIANHRQAAGLVLEHLQRSDVVLDYVGHRFVHGGSRFQQSVFLTTETLEQLELCTPLAPIHNPNSLSVIHACRAALPGVAQYATFDTAFHASIPDYAAVYPLPAAVNDKFGFRKFGFHGLSYMYVLAEAARYLGSQASDLRLVACHLGTGGSSVVAIQGGRSLDTSMGYSPLPGLVMSTRCGNIDPTIPVYLMKQGHSPDQVTGLLNQRSGLLGVSGVSSDLRDLIRRADEEGDERSRLALDLYVYRLKKYIGSYVTILGGIDVLVFTDDIGVQNPRVRAGACEGMTWCGIVLDRERNRQAPTGEIARLSSDGSPVCILSVPTDEELVIGLEGLRLWRGEKNVDL
jgi:acetate kinase